MKKHLESLVSEALVRLRDDELPPESLRFVPEVERTRDSRHGDFATNVALRLATLIDRKPRDVAARVAELLPASKFVGRVAVAGPGFINFFLTPAALEAGVAEVVEAGERYGESDSGTGRHILVEYVSANPTGPLHVGHGRHAAYGASVANLLRATGHQVHEEYYVNDTGRQMDILALSVWLRYLEAHGEKVEFPANGYRGDYIRQIAALVTERYTDSLVIPATMVFTELAPARREEDQESHIDALIAAARDKLGPEGFARVLDTALESVLADIRDDLAEFGVRPDQWYSERSLEASGAIDRALARLRDRGKLYEKGGAQWFRATEYGDVKDRVVIRENGKRTYFSSDIAYHLHKRERGNEVLLDILGADHHGYIARVRAGLEAMGEPGTSLEVRLVQFVTLFRGGEKLRMSTRSGEFVTLRDLRREVGNDAARLFYVLRSNDQHLDFDLELAKSRSTENPVYYIQYAHARVCSVFRQLGERGLEWDAGDGRAHLSELEDAREKSLMTALGRYPEVIELAAANRAPHNLVHYLRELANEFHSYYNAVPFIVERAELRNARLMLICASRQVIQNGLSLLGVSAPESM
ncbi:MAG: arginine--tRNA ligase [Gammaproteobacteria bacterium]|nr:arginine--tRNA ligase [Gammaproteobacteria bacterium]